jgi:hypothetical protein
MSLRNSENEASKQFSNEVRNTGRLPSTNPGFISRIKLRIRSLISGTISKNISYILVISILSWFGINVRNIATGVVAVIHGDLSGISLIAETADIKYIFKEAYQVAVGVDYTWLDYKKKTGHDLHKYFVYIGSGRSIGSHPVLIKEFSEDVDDDCYKDMDDDSTEYLEICDSPATAISKDDAEEYCKENFGAKIATHSELKNSIGGINPVTDSKIDKYRDYPEMTSTLNQEDDDQFMVYYKNTGQEKRLSKELSLNNSKYIDEDSPLIAKTSFRCFIQL